MKHILVIYILLEIMAGCYLYTQLGDSFFQHLVMTIPAVILYVAACFKNPGYADFENIKLAHSDTQINGGVCESTAETSKEDGIAEIGRRECRVCKQPQLIRMKHCYDCNQCVATFDHHCIWIQNCVGQKNRPVFYSCVVMNLVAVGNAFWQMATSMWERGEKEALQIVFLSFLGIILSGLILLTILHTYLMCANLTTWEVTRWQKIHYLAGRSKSQGSPFSEGVISNVLTYWLCGMRSGFQEWTVKTSQAQ